MNIIQQKIQTFRITDRIADLLLLFLSVQLSIVLTNIYQGISWFGLEYNYFNYHAIILIFSVWLILIQIFEHDLVYRRTPMLGIIKNTSLITFVGVTTSITLDFLFKSQLFTRPSIVLFGLISFILLLIKRGWMKYFLSTIRKVGLDPKNILIIGSKRRARRLISELQDHQEYGLNICSILDPDPARLDVIIGGIKVSGDLLLFKKKVKELKIDEVFFAMDLNQIENVQKLFSYLDDIGVSYHMMINESLHDYSKNYSGVSPATTIYYGLPMHSFQAVTASHIKLYVKNWIEKCFALVMILISLPIFFLFAFLIKLSSRGPILFVQERVGLHGRKFLQYKLRSMVLNAEEMRSDFQHLNEQRGPVFKIKNDPRLTKVGKFMRKYSIDELPQLFNILLGSMSLIGPRPLPVLEVNRFSHDILHRRHSMKPGVTGLWQVSGRNDVKDFDQWVQFDLNYIDNWSFGLDLKIALRTVGTVLSGSGM